MTLFAVLVRYRTSTGCNGRRVFVEAADMSDALTIACAKVRRGRGVIRIDGGDVSMPPDLVEPREG